jgi:hypothetical protein
MSVVKPVRSKTLLATLSVLVVVAGMLFSANVASADSVQYQSYQRASQTEACSAQVGETPWQASWGTDSGWKPSWEQWANKGTGGWTCGRSITWARDSATRTYALGDIGPGGGLVFLISGDLTYEMAPKTWSGAAPDSAERWCDDGVGRNITGARGIAIGTGSANTTAMLAFPCTSGAGVSARAYRGGGLTDWFLPSKDELNAMCNYSRTWTGTPPTGACTGTQNGTFASGTYGFASVTYWSSTQTAVDLAAAQDLIDGAVYPGSKDNSAVRVRPVRAF